MPYWHNKIQFMPNSDKNILWFPALASTNNEMKLLPSLKKLAEFSVIATRDQTKGKGQGGNSWESEKGKNLTFSILLRPTPIEIQDQFMISKSIALAIHNVFSNYSDQFSIKWPNDIYYRDKKIGGILIENALSGANIATCIVGIGLNINQTNFCSDAPNPISLANITNKTYDIEEMLQLFILEIEKYTHELYTTNYAPINRSYFENLYRNKGLHSFTDAHGSFNASIKEINPYGHLVLEKEDGTIATYAFKEVSFTIE